ncbi:MAG TPA: hypothetical protein VNC84_00445 [Gammaproteobacteria bacterium]|jgi:hypothetical protein|nr:hypothetical protein [Gammaproteobacteria bacterium]
MIKFKSVLISALTGAALLSAAYACADDAMTPPKPIKNSMYDAMVGTWQGESDMMGQKMRDALKISWGLNHQFLIVDLHAVNASGPKMAYDGKGIFGLTAKGDVKSWWFDSWGADSVSIGTGTVSDNKLELEDSNAMFKEKRTFTIDKDKKEMIMEAKGTMTIDGKETPFEQKVIYKKK